MQDPQAEGGSNGHGEPSRSPLPRQSTELRGPLDEEEDWESLEDGATVRRRSSPATPGSPKRMTSGSPTTAEKRRHSARTKSAPKSPSNEQPAKRRPNTADPSSRSRLSPLAKRLGEDVPLEYAVSQNYPGVMDLSMDGMKLDVSMDDILDPSAAPPGRQGSTAGPPAGANIAPWLQDDSTPPQSGATTPSKQLGPSTTPASMPKLGRLQSDHSLKTISSSRNGSQPSITGLPVTQEPDARTSRQGSGDSLQTLSAAQPKPPRQADVMPGGGRHSIAGGRIGRFGSTVSNVSAGSGDKKKGFLGGLLKRKGTAMSLGPLSDLSPAEHRPSTAGSSSSRISSSTSFGTLATDSPSQLEQGDGSHLNRQYPSMSDGMISPLQELAEPEFRLDMNLDDMEGIVDPNMANAPPTAAPSRHPTLANTAASVEPSTGWGLQDALQQTSQRSEGSSGSVASSQPSGREGYRESVGGPINPFTKVNPFSSGSSNGSVEFKPQTPPSPHAYSPKNSLPPNAQPRRPSQLRNVKMGSIDSDGSNGSRDNGPLQPAWASLSPSQPTVFNDPFGSSKPALSLNPPEDGERTHSRSITGTSQHTVIPETQMLAPAIAGPGAAWAAPESWGVEGDEEVTGDETSSSSGEDNGDWAPEDEPPSPEVQPERRPSLILPISEGKKPPPFGFKSRTPSGNLAQGRPGTATKSGRAKTRDGRPVTASKSGTSNRPGTSGSAHMATTPHLIRIYRADGSYSIHSFRLMTSTHEIINTLSGANDAPTGKRVTTTMKLYLRERGQDRMLLPSEKPLNIQNRRLQQAGFTEAEHPEELGKEDLGTLCKFIYQNPALPVIDPEEESSYDSFEFIDIAGRDLQTIPIFLHLHAHNIIILNVSRNPMTDLPLDFIQACSSLKELRMTSMALKRVPASIRASQTLSRLDVSSNRIADLESVPLHEIQTLLSLKVQNNKLTSIPSYFAQMKALKYLNISNNKFENFPSVVCEMSNLVDLDISFNNIAQLPSEMSNLKSLERLLVYGNDLTTFPESFSTLANLRVLDVRRNKLTDLNSVYALPNLATLQADFNNLVTLDAQIGTKVRQFSVPHNSITRFTLAPLPNMQAVTYSLTHLNLSHGKISTLADEALNGLINLVDLNLDFNQFTRLPSTLDRLVNLEVFSCTDNLLNTFPAGFGQMQKLHTLNAHNNNLREIPGDLWMCGSLKVANFSSNLLESLPIAPETPESSKGILPPAAYSIERIYFGDNHLTSDVFHLLTLVPGIKVVNLSFNDIYEIPPYTLSRCEKLEALYLSGNKLTSLPSEDLEKLQSLKVLHLNGNRLQTLPSELGAIKSLQHLDVGSNVLKYNIANWPYDWNWNWNTGLRYLNLSGNKRLEIKPTSAQDMSHASSLRKELSDFTALTELCVLGLMDVTLRIPSLPDESDSKRVRTSFSDINNMAYGISDMMGALEHMAMFDMVVPNFRGKDNECLFGMFGRPAPSQPSGKVAKFLQESFAGTLSEQLEELEPYEQITDAMRRSFLASNRKCFDYLTTVAHDRKRSVASFSSVDDMFKAWSPGPTSVFKSGASGAVVYCVDKTLYCANAGHAIIVISRKGEAEVLGKKHHCTDREETTRIRRAEAWVSTKGYINDDKDMDISRAFGYWHHAPAVNASPEVRVRELTEYDEFVIIGNNALWACCSYQTAVDIARTERDDPMMAAQKLRDFAISYGAEGSVMVMVVNISDLFGRGRRSRGAGSGPQVMPDPSAVDAEHYATFMRTVRRRYEEVGDRTLNRLQQEIEPPEGQVAIVFTDIVNSTHLWETNPGMPTAIKMHHNLMRRQLRLDGGYEVKTEGDSFMVSFQTVTAAIVWAFNCQIGLLSQEWPRELLQCPDGDVVLDSEGTIVQRGLRVRMGVHWGSPQCERDPITRRMDYYGPMVNRAARINASADGGQLMASQDVIYEIELLRDYLDSLDEEGLNGLPTELKREIQEIRRIGIEMRDMGERKLKGLEVPERLHLLYPKSLSGRLELSNDIRANVEVNDPRALHLEPRQIDIEQVRELAGLALRLEALSAIHHRHQMAHPSSPAAAASPGAETSPKALTVRPPSGAPPPAYLGPAIREEMTDEELSIIIDSLTTRIENTMSSLYLKHLGGFSSVLAALEQATKMDSRLLVHALALMNGHM